MSSRTTSSMATAAQAARFLARNDPNYRNRTRAAAAFQVRLKAMRRRASGSTHRMKAPMRGRFSPSRTKSKHAILLRNPHLQWNAGYYEAHLPPSLASSRATTATFASAIPLAS